MGTETWGGRFSGLQPRGNSNWMAGALTGGLPVPPLQSLTAGRCQTFSEQTLRPLATASPVALPNQQKAAQGPSQPQRCSGWGGTTKTFLGHSPVPQGLCNTALATRIRAVKASCGKYPLTQKTGQSRCHTLLPTSLSSLSLLFFFFPKTHSNSPASAS